nr:hypothetical protein [Tanacetum cinerariifolium]
EINSLNDVVVDHMHQPWRTFTFLINKSLSGKTTGLDNLHLSRAQIFLGRYHQKNVDYVELLWEDFIYQMDNKAYKKQEKMYYPRFTKVIIHYFLTQDKTLSWRNKIRMYTSRDDYLINTLRFKPASPKLTTVLVSTETLTRKSKREKTHAKKSAETPARGVVIRETLEMPLTKKKEKVDVTHGKGIELLSQVALTEDAHFEELINKRMRDFHKSHPSRFGTVTKTALSVAKIKPSATSEGTGVRPGVPDVAEEESSGNNELELDLEHENDASESGSEFDHDESEESEEDDDKEDETKITDKVEGDKDEKMDYTTGQLYDDVDIRLNEPVDTDKGFVQEEGTDAAMTNVQQVNENPKILQVIEDAHMTLSTVPQKTKVPDAKILNFLDIPHTDAKIVSPLDVHIHHELPNQQTPTLLTVPVSVITDSSPVFSTIIPQSLPSFTPSP